MKITAAVVPVRSAPFEIETLDLAAPLADEVLVRVVASGMCHTDLHARDGYFPNLPYPVVCGHEGAGIIEQVGADVADLAPGDPVVISFPWCGECGPCRAERISYCERARPLKSSMLFGREFEVETNDLSLQIASLAMTMVEPDGSAALIARGDLGAAPDNDVPRTKAGGLTNGHRSISKPLSGIAAEAVPK